MRSDFVYRGLLRNCLHGDLRCGCILPGQFLDGNFHGEFDRRHGGWIGRRRESVLIAKRGGTIVGAKQLAVVFAINLVETINIRSWLNGRAYRSGDLVKRIDR